jgi:hypothetical protein
MFHDNANENHNDNSVLLNQTEGIIWFLHTYII